jgi:hypothetical protein
LKGKELQDVIDKECNEEDDKIKRSSGGKPREKKGEPTRRKSKRLKARTK